MLSNVLMLKNENLDEDILSVLMHWGCKGVVVVVDTDLRDIVYNYLLYFRKLDVDISTITSITNKVITSVLEKFTVPKVKVTAYTLGNLISNSLYKYRYSITVDDIDVSVLDQIINVIEERLLFLINRVCPDIKSLCVDAINSAKFATVINFINQKNISIIYFAIIEQD